MVTKVVPESIKRIIAALTSHQYTISNEAKLQDAIAGVLSLHNVIYERERRIGKRNRVDFLVTASCGCKVALEVKVQGALSAVAMQLHRYAESTKVNVVILATTLNRLTSLPDEMANKPVYAVRLSNGMF